MYANSIVSLEPKTLKLRDYFTEPRADFSASPLVFQHKGNDLIVAAGKDGRLYILNRNSLSGTDHRTAPSSTAVGAAGTDPATDAPATSADADGPHWDLSPTASA